MRTCVHARGHPDTHAVSSLPKLYVALQDHCRTRAQLTTDCRRREQHGACSTGTLAPGRAGVVRRSLWGLGTPKPLPAEADCGSSGLLLLGCVLRSGCCGRLPTAGEPSRMGAAQGPLPWPASARCGSSCWKATQGTLRSLLRQGQAPSAALQSCPTGSLDTRSLRVGFAA